MEPRPPAVFVGGAPGLDFLNSIAAPGNTTIDWLDDGEGYVSWLEQAGLAPTDALRGVIARVSPGALDKVAEEARDLREWFRRFVRRHMGRPLAAEALAELAPINRLLERDESFSRIVPSSEGDRPFRLEVLRRWRVADTLLAPIGEALAQFVCREDFERVKDCPGPACTLIFVDHTRGHARRWCSMEICGNRVKQATHRRRTKGHSRARP